MSDISRQIWDMKYRLKAADGTPMDRDVADSWARVALAWPKPKAPAERRQWRRPSRKPWKTANSLPAGRILAGAGTGRAVTLFNCFVMGTIPDSMDGIFSALREAALTLQQGGGIGYDFSTLRPKGAAVAGVGADASGPVSFMDVWDAMCRTIMSAGVAARRHDGDWRWLHPPPLSASGSFRPSLFILARARYISGFSPDVMSAQSQQA